MPAKIVEVIMVEENAKRIYYTQEGQEIGSLDAGKRVKAIEKPASESKPSSGVVTSLTPEQVRKQKARDNDGVISAAKRAAQLVQ